MAKAKKAKNEEQKGGDSGNSEAVVNHQKLCLSIDMENRRIYGFTELQMVVPDNGIVGLHSDNLVIESVTVDGEPAEYEVFPHYQQLDPKDRWRVVSSATSAADASGSVYLSSLEIELLPNLLIMCSKPNNPENNQRHELIDNGEQSSADTTRLCCVQNAKQIRIGYWVEKAETGIHFNGNVLHTDNQMRRARCWFPCMDDGLQCCCYDLEFTVASDLVAVSSGTLLHQVLTNDNPPRKIYVYRVDIPVAAQWISLAVAPFKILPDRHSSVLSHVCLPAFLSKLPNTLVFFYNAFSHYEDYLSSSFPFGSYTQVFISPEMAISSSTLGASMSIFSSHVLFDEKHIDQTIETRIRLAHALARQWFGVYISPESPTDEWLLDGLAGFLTDTFIKRFLGNNEARYRRYKANCAVCQADDSGATALSSTMASKDLFGTQGLGFYGKIRSWKSVAVLQMLEKQMGPESFRKILQNIIARARDGDRFFRTLSTKEFRHFANKVGNLERPFLKEFFPRWVGSCGCPVLKMGFSYNKRKNMVELAVLRGCTSRPDSCGDDDSSKTDPENRECSVGWPGMMSIRVHELDGMYDHPILPMAGEQWQLLEIQCHSKLAAKRFQKTKKGTKTDGSDDNADPATNTDLRMNSDSPLLWLHADPEMEYLAEVHFNQPVQMWINQLEKDKDVIAQAQAIAALEALPQLSFSVVNALNTFLNDSKAFWRVRIQAAYALASTATEDTDWAGLLHLINFYKSRRFDPNIGLPRPNDFHDFPEYFVLEAIPHAIAMVRSSDKKSPRESVEFILQLLKYNDNNGNVYSDAFWLAALVRSVGELEFGQQSTVYLPSLLKRLDRLLQFDRLMPSHNGILTINCIRSLTQVAVKLSEFISLDRVVELIRPYRVSKIWQIRVDAARALLELEFQSQGIDAALIVLIRYLNDETSLRGQIKLAVCALRVCQIAIESGGAHDVKRNTLVDLLHFLESSVAFNNVILRHYIFCILQVLAARLPTLFGVPRDETLRTGHTRTSSELKNIFAALVKQSNLSEPSFKHLHVPLVLMGHKETDSPFAKNELAKAVTENAEDSGQRNPVSPLPDNNLLMIPEMWVVTESHEPAEQILTSADVNFIDDETPVKADTLLHLKEKESVVDLVHDDLVLREASKEPGNISINREPKKSKLIIKVKQSAASCLAEFSRNPRIMKSQDGHNDADRGASSSVSVDAPQRNFGETLSASNQNFEDAYSCHDVGSRVTASIGSAKPLIDGEDLVKELQCTADSSKVILPIHLDLLPTSSMRTDTEPQSGEGTSATPFSIKRNDVDCGAASPNLRVFAKDKEKKKEKKKKKKRNEDDDPARVERKRLKKEKKRKQKELAKLFAHQSKHAPSEELPSYKKRSVDIGWDTQQGLPLLTDKEHLIETRQEIADGEEASSSAGTHYGITQPKQTEPIEIKVVPSIVSSPAPPNVSSRKIKIKLKNRTVSRP